MSPLEPCTYADLLLPRFLSLEREICWLFSELCVETVRARWLRKVACAGKVEWEWKLWNAFVYLPVRLNLML
jgi:hypothetical protein